MKQLFLTIGIGLITAAGFAQKGNVTNAAMAYKDFKENQADGNTDAAIKDIMEAKKYIDLAINHPDTKETPKALMYQGKIYIELSSYAAGYKDNPAFEGLNVEETAENGFNALVHSKEVDTKERYVDDVNGYAGTYRALFSNLGISSYDEGKYEVAMGALLGAAQFAEIMGDTDSLMYFYGALSGFNVEQWEIAEEGFAKCLDIGYNAGSAAYYYSQACQKRGDVAKAEEGLKKYQAKYPDNKDILIELINLYIDTDRNEEAEKALGAAIELDPNNTALIYTSGNIYETMGRVDDAEKAYLKTIEIDQDNVNAKFSLGGLYFNKGADINNEANKLPFGDPNYEKMVQESKDYFGKALPYLEQAAAAEPKDVVILESLKAVYGKLGMTDKFKETKAKIAELKG